MKHYTNPWLVGLFTAICITGALAMFNIYPPIVLVLGIGLGWTLRSILLDTLGVKG